MDLRYVILTAYFCMVMLVNESFGKSYSIIHSKMFRIDSDETIVVNLQGYGSSAVQVLCTITDYPRRSRSIDREQTNGNADQPIQFSVNVGKEHFQGTERITNKQVEMRIRIQFPGSSHSTINKNIRVFLTGESDYIFIVTERPIYKPTDEVQIRVIPLNIQMLPVRNEMVKIEVKTPDGIGVWKSERQWVAEDDFLEFTYEIVDDPPLGKWFITAKINNTLHTSSATTSFLIDKYVLPTYDVSMKMEKSYLKPDEILRGSFVAMYSYGENVVGIYTITASVKLPGSEELFEFHAYPSSHRKRPGQLRERNKGRGTFEIPTELVTNATEMSWEELIDARATVTVQVSVMGFAEGTFESDEISGILITNSPFVIDMSHTSQYFIPSRTHNIRIVVRDVVSNKPVPGIPVWVESNGRRQGTTDGGGFVNLLANTPARGDRMTVTIRTGDPGTELENQATVSYTLTKYNSRSGAYLDITAPGHSVVRERLDLEFQPINASPTEIFYMILSRGVLILSGKKQVSNPGAPSAQSVPVTRVMSPSIRVVAYFKNGDDVISNSVWIDIDDVCISQELSVESVPSQVLPGHFASFNFEGEPRALVGMSAVDRSAYFMHDESRLDRKKMFKMMNSFDFGCALSGGRDGLDVFKEAGLSYTQNNMATAYQANHNCSSNDGARSRKKRRSELSTLETPLEKKCFKHGRIMNLAGESCNFREARVAKWPKFSQASPEEKQSCTVAFMRGCIEGETVRERIAFENKYARSSSFKVDRGSQQPMKTRSRFLESWLWAAETLDSSGRGWKRNVLAPDGITTYDVDAVSVHNTKGFCVAQPAEIRVFKEIFIQLYLPYSVKVLEQVQIKAAIFNYHPSSPKVIDLRIRADRNLCTQYKLGDWSDNVATLEIASRSSASFSFTVIPLKTGILKIELEASAIEQVIDSIKKDLLVEESGSEDEFSGSLDFELSGNRNKEIQFQFPDDNVVPGSKKCWVYGHMSFLGPLIEFDSISETPKNLADSIKIPHGCGEQNMMDMGPNVFVFNYLKNRGDARASDEAEIQKFIKAGYTRQQSHRNKGVWSVWSHSPPTIWLNAYVNKVFLHALNVWPDMNIGPICQSLFWITSQQESRGQFSESTHATYYTIHVASGGEVALTAYVMIAIAEADSECPDADINERIQTAIDRAHSYLRAHANDDVIVPYTAAIVSYALALMDPRGSATISANNRLLAMKRQSGDEIYWQTASELTNDIDLPPWYQNKHATIDIEATAYALLAQVTIAEEKGSRVEQSTVRMINNIARWLVNQKNERGGFQTSQTTVTAVQALTKYMSWIELLEPAPRNPYMNFILRSNSGTWSTGHSFSINRNNEFYKKELVVPPDVVRESRSLAVQLDSGEGRGSISYRCVYRLTKDAEVCHFNISAETSKMGYLDEAGTGEAAPGEGKNVIKLKITVSKITPGDTGMAIIQIGLMSGFRPIESSLEALAINNVVDGIIDRYEISNQSVTIYAPKIPSEDGSEPPLKIAFTLQQYADVSEPNPASILVYDYYEPEVKCSKFYAAPGNLPTLQTMCNPSGVDNAASQECKCVAGGCPTCRTREEQLAKTCGARNKCNHACNRDPYECFNLHHSVCRRNFGFLVEIQAIDNSTSGFVKLTGSVLETFRKSGDDQLLRSEETRTFLMRKKCFDGCYDVSVRDLDGDTYFIPRRTFLIMGRHPEKSVLSSGENSVTYFLDRDAVIERTLSLEKCKRKEKKRNQCWNSRTDQCIKINQQLKICDNQKILRKYIRNGCDIGE